MSVRQYNIVRRLSKLYKLRRNMDPDEGVSIDRPKDERVEVDLEDVHRYVSAKEYRAGLTKDQKRRIREKSSSFSDHEGVLMRRNFRVKCIVFFRCFFTCTCSKWTSFSLNWCIFFICNGFWQVFIAVF